MVFRWWGRFSIPHAPTALTPFTFEGAAVRVVTREGEPWFVLADVCKVLDVGNVSDAGKRLDDDEKDGVDTIDAIGRPQKATVINESGLYSLVLSSRKPEAKRFKKWITSEVLPALTTRDGKVLANSRDVAAMFEREHKEIMRNIRELEIGGNLHQSFFLETTLPDAYGRPQPAYEMTRDGFTLLAMGFTGSKALQFKLAYIAEFNRMEAALREPAPETREQGEVSCRIEIQIRRRGFRSKAGPPMTWWR